MTPVGHTLTGLALATAALPLGASRRRAAAALGLGALAALAPDLPLPGWGHDGYRTSHSLVVALALLAPVGAVLALRPGPRDPLTRGRGFAVLAAAWGSHVVLDGLYSHGQGVPALWPLAEARLALPLPFLHAVRIAPFDAAHNARVAGVELLFFGAILAAALGARAGLGRRRAGGRSGLDSGA